MQCNAEALPFPDDSFDLVTIAFGLRNVTDKDAALREMLRVLKVGGQARVLEFSQVQADVVQAVVRLPFVQGAAAAWASCSPTMPTATSTWPSRSASIRRRKRCKAMMESAGFARCDYHNLNAGIVAIHTGYKV